MKYAMDVKVNVRPVFSNMVHSGWWEGPCHVGPREEGTPEYEIRTGREQFKLWCQELKSNLDQTRCQILEPVYLEFDESFLVRDKEFAKLEKENHLVDLYLITYRIPGLERLNKPVSMIDLGPTPLDVIGYYSQTGIPAYMTHDYREYNQLLTCLQVKKAMANTKILILSNTEQIPTSVNTACCDFVSLYRRYGIRNSRVDFHQAFAYFEGILVDDAIRREAEELIRNASRSDTTQEYLCNDLRYFHAVRKMMEFYECNAFTTPCKELCASRFPQKNKFVPCMAQSLNKDDRIPSACEEDINALLAMMVMMYLTRQSVFMGNPVLIPAGTKNLGQLGMQKLLPQLKEAFDHDVLEIHHAVPVRKMNGFDKEPQKYELGHFTTQGWGTHYHIDMTEREGQIVTMGRFNRSGDSMIVARARTVGTEFRPVYCSPAVFYDVEGGARAFRQALVRGGYGHHQAIIYGDHIDEITALGEIAGFRVEVFR